MSIGTMLELQAVQQATFEGFDKPPSRAEARKLATEYAQYLNGEVVEYLNSIAYKRHLAVEEAPYATRLNEWIDMYKYLLCIAWAEGFTSLDIAEAFYNKTETVYARHQRELMESKIASFDIDGVLADISSGGYDRDWDMAEIDRWHADGNIAQLPVIPQMARVVRHLKQQGWSIVLTTSRKRHRHANVEHETYRWLQRHDIPCDYISWSYDKSEGLAEAGITPQFHVEDTPKHALDMASWGVTTWLVGDVMPDLPIVGGKIIASDYKTFGNRFWPWLARQDSLKATWEEPKGEIIAGPFA